MVPILVVLAIVAFVVVDIVVQAVSRRRESAKTQRAQTRPEANHHLHWEVELPAGYFVHRGHSWGRIEKDGSLVVGMDDFARQMLGAPDTVKLPRLGTPLKAGEPMATLYRKDRLAHLPAPADGVVVDIHSNVILRPQTLAKDPYGEGWLVRLRPEHLGQAVANLRVAEEAATFEQEEVLRMRSFLESHPSTAIAADGGKPVEGILGVLSARAWDAFRRNFLHESI